MDYANLKRRIEESTELYKEATSQSIGTDEYHKINPFAGDRIVASDGAIEICDDHSSFWFMDIVCSYLGTISKYLKDTGDNFLTVGICKSKVTSGCLFYIHNGEDKVIRTQNIEYTDMETNIRMYLQHDGTRWVIFATSEY